LSKRAKIVEFPTPPSEPLITYADITKARKLLNYNPTVNIEQGLARFIEWMRQEKLLPA